MFTEEYQVDFLGEYHKVFDEFRDKFLVGEMVWVFADFMTAQGLSKKFLLYIKYLYNSYLLYHFLPALKQFIISN